LKKEQKISNKNHTIEISKKIRKLVQSLGVRGVVIVQNKFGSQFELKVHYIDRENKIITSQIANNDTVVGSFCGNRYIT
jgi:CO dehydrogenase nickel-insertion accessory protein CooC1